MIRLILIILFIIAAVAFFLPLLIVLYFLRNVWPAQVASITQALAWWGMRTILFIGGAHLKIQGQENIPREGNVLFVSNHRSDLDILAGYGSMHKRTAFVAKKELFSVPLLRRAMEMLHCIFLNRNDKSSGAAMIGRAVELVKTHSSVWICPEGTRNKQGGRIGLLMFHNGSFKIAQEGNVPVVPVAIVGTREMFEDHLPFFTPGRVVITYGKPVDLKTLSEDETAHIGDYFNKIVADMLLKVDEEMGYGEEGRYSKSA